MTSPKDIKDYLDEYVIGQEDAKEVISNALFLHLARSNYKIENPDTKFKKSNLLIMGPSGCGKTYIVERAAEFVKVPFFKLNAKSLSNTGFVGQSIQSFFEDFYEDCTNTAMFNYCIVFIDEFDKICQPARS
jgi:ATP-dependent Clp protease ATP-binding subunit ClpX